METLHRFVDYAVSMKMNQLQLYVEHSFAFSFLSEIQGGEDTLTPEEVMELDFYCMNRGIELVPCLASFGHLYMILSSRSWAHLCEKPESAEAEFSFINRQQEHTINVNHPQSAQFIQKLHQDFLPLFSSRKFNICADETFDLGKGLSKGLIDSRGKAGAYFDFLQKILKYPRALGFEVMVFGDIVLKYSDLVAKLPEDIILLDWDYSPRPEPKARKILGNAHQRHYTIPAVLGWNRLLCDYKDAYRNIQAMAQWSHATKADGILIIHWGDYGHTLPLAAALPAFAMGGAFAWNPEESRDAGELIRDWAIIRYGRNGTILAEALLLASQHPNYYFRGNYPMAGHTHDPQGNCTVQQASTTLV